MDNSKKLPPRDEVKREEASFFVVAVFLLAGTFVYLGWSLGTGAQAVPPQAMTSVDAPEKAPEWIAPAPAVALPETAQTAGIHESASPATSSSAVRPDTAIAAPAADPDVEPAHAESTLEERAAAPAGISTMPAVPSPAVLAATAPLTPAAPVAMVQETTTAPATVAPAVPDAASPAKAAPKPEAKDAPAGSADAAKFPQAYVVQQSDTLSSLAQRFYGSSKAWRKIYQANSAKLPNPDRLSAGMELTIPAP